MSSHFKLFFITITQACARVSVCVCVCVCLCVCLYVAQHTCEDQRATFTSQFSPSILWVLELELSFSRVVPSAFSCWAIVQALYLRDIVVSYRTWNFLIQLDWLNNKVQDPPVPITPAQGLQMHNAAAYSVWFESWDHKNTSLYLCGRCLSQWSTSRTSGTFIFSSVWQN